MQNHHTISTEATQPEKTGQVISFQGTRDVQRSEVTEAVQLWRFDRDLSEALTREEIGAMDMVKRLDAQRKTLIIGMAHYLRKHERSDVAMGVYLVLTLLSDNENGVASVSQPTLSKLFRRSVSSIADAQRRLREDGLIKMSRGRYAGSMPVIPRMVTQQYNHLTWILSAVCADDAPLNHLGSPDDCQSSGQTGGLKRVSDQSLGGTGGLKPANHPVDGGSIIRPDSMQLHTKLPTTIHKAAAVVASGISALLPAMPVAANSIDPPSEARPSEMDIHQLASVLHDAGGQALNLTRPALHVMEVPKNWIGAGCDLEKDIVPTITAMCRGKDPSSVASWKYFEGAIFSAKSARTAPLPSGETRTERPKPSWLIEKEKEAAAYAYLFREDNV